jgi:hypothetical protein
MPILTFPAGLYTPSSVTWLPRANTQTFRSPLDGTQQTIELPGIGWVATVGWDRLPEPQWRKLAAWISQLRGAAGRFYYGPVHAAARRATGTIGTPLVNGANQTGTTLNIDGLGVSQQVFLAGDFFAYDHASGRSLHVITADATSNASGQAALAIEPPIRVSPADNAAIVHSSPTCVMRLASDDEGSIDVGPGLISSLTLSMVEAWA